MQITCRAGAGRYNDINGRRHMTLLPIRSAATALVQSLQAQGVDLVFAVAGESYLAVLNALYEVRDQVRLVTCRHEANAANMAEACGKLTGRPGVCFVTRGPGATHASIALHTAQQDATPLVLFVGQVARADLGRNAFQEIDFTIMFGGIAKWVAQITDPEMLPSVVAEAFQRAMSDRPGPVVISLPEDMLDEPCTAPIAAQVTVIPRAVDLAVISSIARALAKAKHPLVWVGGSGWTPEGVDALHAFISRWNLPVANGFRRKDLYPTSAPHYIGEFGFAAGTAVTAALKDADLVLVIGAALGDVETGGYMRLDPTIVHDRVIHVATCAEDLNRVFKVRIGTYASPLSTCKALVNLEAPVDMPWNGWTEHLRTLYLADLAPVPVTGDVNPSEVFLELRRQLPKDAIVANGAGNYAAWLHRFFQHDVFPTQLAPQSGAMGYGVPAAIAAALLYPRRKVVAVSGDGCFMMAANELITAVANGANVVFLILNNGSFGTIRMHQEMRYPGRTHATNLVNPDFVMLAAATGIPAVRVTTTVGFSCALSTALAANGPRLIELVTSVEDIAPNKRLSELSGTKANG